MLQQQQQNQQEHLINIKTDICEKYKNHDPKILKVLDYCVENDFHIRMLIVSNSISNQAEMLKINYKLEDLPIDIIILNNHNYERLLDGYLNFPDDNWELAKIITIYKAK